MDEPERSTILSLAAGSTVLRPEWISVPYKQRSHLQSSFKMFSMAAKWAKVNPQMSKALLEDIARYAKGPQSPPTGTILNVLIRFEPIGPGVWKPLVPGRENEAVEYLKSKRTAHSINCSRCNNSTNFASMRRPS
jgi:hypothetical protein